MVHRLRLRVATLRPFSPCHLDELRSSSLADGPVPQISPYSRARADYNNQWRRQPWRSKASAGWFQLTGAGYAHYHAACPPHVFVQFPERSNLHQTQWLCCLWRDRFSREHGQHAYRAVSDAQWVTSEANHPFFLGPCSVTDSRVIGDIIDQMRFSILCNHPNFELSHRNMAVRSVKMCVNACAGLQLQHLSIVTQGPNPRECCIEMAHYGFAAFTQDRFQTFFLAKSHAHVSAHRDLTGVRCSHFLSLLSFTDIADVASKYFMPIAR